MRAAWVLCLTACGSFAVAPEPGTDAGGVEDAATADAGGPCSGPLLVGTSTIETGTNTIGAGSLDAFGYSAVGTGLATCAYVYINEDLGPPLHVGVYESGSDLPTKLLGRAIVDRPKRGWNTARLEKPLMIEQKEVYWLGVISTEPFTMPTRQGCSSRLQLIFVTNAGSLTDTFPTNNRRDTLCDSPIYLTP